MSKIDLNKDECLNKDDFTIANYKDRFKKSRTNRYKKIGFLSVSFFDIDLDTSINYVYNGDLCYLKYLRASQESDFTHYEVRKIIGSIA
ncbi:MAG: hypothetical protein U9O83_06160 [Campylobacterota bacterium]|nr:hypothetical protein [Campylobacterota bacterium]